MLDCCVQRYTRSLSRPLTSSVLSALGSGRAVTRNRRHQSSMPRECAAISLRAMHRPQAQSGRNLRPDSLRCFRTLKNYEGESDKGWHFNRPGVYRLSFRRSAKIFASPFGARPMRPGKGGAVAGPWNFTALNVLMPHPVYGWMGWIAVLNPTTETFERMMPFLNRARKQAETRIARRSGDQIG